MFLIAGILLLICGDVHPNPGPPQIQSFLKLCHVNARSLTTLHRLELIEHFLVLSDKYDIIAISETHIDDTVSSYNLELPGYSLFRRDRNRDGGGVALYIVDTLVATRRLDLESPDLESIWVEVAYNENKMLVGTCYRPPGMLAEQVENFLDGISNTFDLLLTANIKVSPVVLLGDFNDRCTSWFSDHTQYNSELGNKLVRLLEAYNLAQLITEPTRYDYLLDLLITDSPELFNISGVTEPPDPDLDHDMIYGHLSFKYKYNKTIKRETWQYSKANFEALNAAYTNIPWHIPIDDLDLEDSVENISALILDTAKQHIPFRQLTVRSNDKPGMTDHVKYLFKKCNTLNKKRRRTGNPLDAAEHLQARREAKQAWKEARDSWEANLIKKLEDPQTSQKIYWKTLKNFYGKKKKEQIPTLIDGNKHLCSNIEKANVLNDYFVSNSKLPTHQQTEPLPELNRLCDEMLNEIHTNHNEVEKILRSLNSNKATGPDGIPNKILKDCAKSLSFPLADLFNKSLSLGRFPGNWKKVHVHPIPKSGDKQSKSNYRPISLLSCISKVLERIVYNRLYNHCKNHGLLNPRNSGFKPCDSATNRLIELVHNIHKGLDDSKEVCVVFLDITKAFDRVWHDGLIYKLQEFGIRGELLEWFRSYLNGREQRVVVGGEYSHWKQIEAGVPQGSVLGPLLFLIFINDITQNIESDMSLFADDSTLVQIGNDRVSMAETINRDLNTLAEWGKRWFVSFNALKTKFMLITNRRIVTVFPPLIMNVTQLKQVSEHVVLGLTLTEKLTWTSHIQRLYDKSLLRLNILKSLCAKLPRSTKVNLYKTFIRPVLEHCNLLYVNATFQDLKLLDKIQRTSAVVCTRAYRCTETGQLYIELGWDSLATRRKIHTAVLLYKVLKCNVSPYLKLLLPILNHGRTLRNQGKLKLFRCRTTKFYNSILPIGVKIWNSLPVNIQNSPSINSFKRNVIRHFGTAPSLHVKYCRGPESHLHARLRMGLSALNQHRFTYNFIQTRLCDHCQSPESTIHFFHECPAYAAQRVELYRRIAQLHPPFIHLSKSQKIQLLLIKDTENLNVNSNIINGICEEVHKYLSRSERF